MESKQQAEELVKSFRFDTGAILMTDTAKGFALLCVDEIIKTCNQIVQSSDCAPYYEESYWHAVKQEIEKL